MLEVKGIENGVVIDHISAGNGIRLFNELFKDTKHPVVLLMNVESKALGKKDIIKIENTHEVDLDLLGLMDPNITVNYIENEKLVKKVKTEIPTQIKGGIKCQNPRCISHTDDYAIPEFQLIRSEGRIEYECNYCEEISVYRLPR
ncbi:MAG: aspartate carbamoyltransferase regulatory subunit [Bacillota bacterium]|nr:aspartate carbamoyltransferase regulatory subunit [Bacillota bacterium]